jgi:hypothetical protein
VPGALHCCTFPHTPRLVPDLRFSLHPAQHLRSFSMVKHTMQRLFAFLQHTRSMHCVQLARSLDTFVPVFPKARGLRRQSHPGVLSFPGFRLLCPIRLSPLASSIHEAFPPHYFPTALGIHRGVSRVQRGSYCHNHVDVEPDQLGRQVRGSRSGRGEPVLRHPIRYTFPAGCASVTSGAAFTTVPACPGADPNASAARLGSAQVRLWCTAG